MADNAPARPDSSSGDWLTEVSEKRFEMAVIEGLWLAPNACSRCQKWFPPYMAAIPNDEADAYCWGHKPENARKALDALISRKVTEGRHYQWWIDLHEYANEIIATVLEAPSNGRPSDA